MKTDFSPVARPLRRGQLAQRLDDCGELFVMLPNSCVEFGEFRGNGFMINYHLPELNERPYHVNAHFRGRIAVKDVRSLDRTVFGEGVGKTFGKT